MKRVILDLNNPHIIKNSARKKTKLVVVKKNKLKLVVAIIVCAVFALTVVFGVVFYNNHNQSIKKYSFYILVLSKESSLSAAENEANRIIAAGGSGYIINDGQFLITGFTYKSKKDAEIILERVKEDFKNAEILSLKGKKTRLNGLKDKKNREKLKSLLNFPIVMINNIIDYAYLLDSYKSTDSQIMLKTEKLSNDLLAKVQLLKALVEKGNVEAYYALDFYQGLITSLSRLNAIGESDKSLSHRLKSFSCNAAFNYDLLRKQLISL